MTPDPAAMTRTFDVPGHVVSREVEGELVILDLDSGQYFGLNAVGARLWALLAGGASLGAAHAALLDEFDVEADVLERDLLELVGDLEAARLITVRS